MTLVYSHYIYGLCGPDMHIRYIGQTSCDIRHRVSGHLSAAKKGNSEFHRWLVDVGTDLIAVELERVNDRIGRRALEKEKWWITHAIENGCDLFNKFIPGASEKFKIISREEALEVVPILKNKNAGLASAQS